MAMFPVVDVSGGAFERGRMHGEAARGRVERSLANYARLFEFNGMPWTEAQRHAVPFRDVIGSFDALLLEEIEGIARGAGRSEGEILALNARTELLPSQYLTGKDDGECTAIAVCPAASSTGGTLLAQNWDWVGSQRESLVLLRVPESDTPACLTLTEAGILAKIGLNARGFGVCLNILRSTVDGERPGVPVHVLLRALLKCSSTHDAILLASKLAFGSSSNVLCADASGDSASLEVSPKGLRVVRGDGATLCHTNHFLDPEAAAWQAALLTSISTVPRLERAREIAASRSRHGIEDVKRLLRDESAGLLSICRKPDASLPPEARIESVASVIMELARGVMHVAPDVPSRAEYRPVALSAEEVPA
jgi:isopenicillin-N N-acyltransferase-like protein